MLNDDAFAANPPQPVFTTGQTARLIQFHPESVRRAIRQRRIHAVRFGAGWRVPAEEIQRILREGLPVTTA